MLTLDTFKIKINILIVKIINNELNALFWKRKEGDNWELPSQALSYNQSFESVCKSILSEIVNHKSLQEFNFRLAGHFINEKTVELNYLCLSKKFKYSFIYNDKLKDITWVNSNKIGKFNFSADILSNNFEFIRFFILNNPEHIFYLIKNEFTLTELQDAFLSLDLENKQFNEKRNFRKWLFQKSKLKNFIEETDKIRTGQHRPAKIFRLI